VASESLGAKLPLTEPPSQWWLSSQRNGTAMGGHLIRVQLQGLFVVGSLDVVWGGSCADPQNVVESGRHCLL